MSRRAPEKHAVYYELLEELQEPGCAACRVGARAAGRYFAGLGGEHMTDPGIRSTLRAALGFCPRHAHQFAALPNRLGTAILYEDLLGRVEAELDRWAKPGRHAPPAACPACEAAQSQEAGCLETLARFIEDPDLAAAHQASVGFCLPHTLALCARLREPARSRVVAQERERIARLRAALKEFVRKNDYRYRDEPWGEEKSAPPRAVAKVVGEDGSR